MSVNFKKKRSILRWNKTAISEILGCEIRELDIFLSDETKEKVGFKKGRQEFTDQETFHILKDFRRLYSDQQIIDLIYPGGIK